MSGPKIIPGNPYTFDATSENANPGDMVLDPTGAVQGVGIVARFSGATRADQGVIPTFTSTALSPFTWTAGAGGSGDGTIGGTVRGGLSGIVLPTSIVRVNMLSSGAIASVTATTGTLRGRGITTNDAWVDVEPNSSGVFVLAFNGATGATLAVNAYTVAPAQSGSAIGELSVTLP